MVAKDAAAATESAVASLASAACVAGDSKVASLALEAASIARESIRRRVARILGQAGTGPGSDVPVETVFWAVVVVVVVAVAVADAVGVERMLVSVEQEDKDVATGKVVAVAETRSTVAVVAA
jgi:hypothetical protein